MRSSSAKEKNSCGVLRRRYGAGAERCLECDRWEWRGEVMCGQTLPNEIGFAVRFGLGAFLGGKERVLNLNASERL